MPVPSSTEPAEPAAAADTPATPHAAPDSTPALYTVSVRSLCEFTAKHGSLDRRFTPSATALEGIAGQQTVAARRGQDYETELVLEGRVGALRVRGRADGYDPRRRCLEEIKTLRGQPGDVPENRQRLHWAQLETYGALFCRARRLPELALALVYFDTDTQTETELRQVFGAQELEDSLLARCAAFADWAAQEAAHRTARDAGLRALAFPPGAFRTGQRSLAEAVYRTATRGGSLLAQAPTGIGKTVGTLFPLLRAMPGQRIDKVAYLTCKGTGRLTALNTLRDLRAGVAGQALRVLAMVPKEQACEHPDKACHGDACPLAHGFYDRLAAARQQAVALAWLDPPAQRQVALAHGICPYYLGQELVRWADVLVGDVHHYFDANGQLWGLMQALDWRLAVLVDEAHNLPDRARQMYTAALRLGEVQAAAGVAPAAVRAPLQRLAAAIGSLSTQAGRPYAVLDPVPDAALQALQTAAAALAAHFQQQPLAVGGLLNFHFGLQRFLRLAEALSAHSLFEVQTTAVSDLQVDAGTAAAAVAVASDVDVDVDVELALALDASASDPDGASAASDVQLCVRNVSPAVFLRQRLKLLHSLTLFSATLAPADYAVKLLGLPEDTGWIDVPPAFPAEHLCVQVADGLSTRWPDRARSLPRLVGILASQYDAQPGNYLAFFSSFDYLDKAAARLAAQRPDIPQWRQERRMGPGARQAFLDRFAPGGRGIGFAVLGGVFAEGVDLPGSLLIGAFIATLGLPPVSEQQTQVQARLNQLLGGEPGQGERVPAMHKVVQAAGRVLRTPHDRGWLWLLDERYRHPEVRTLLPPSWGLG